MSTHVARNRRMQRKAAMIKDMPEQQKPEHEALLTREGFGRLEYVDGLRAVAALWVVFSHLPVLPASLSNAPIASSALSVLRLNRFAVMMFLTISGFCLYYPLARKNPTSPTLNLSYIAFVARRARRLMPPYFAALLLSLALIWLIPVDIHNPNPTNAASIASHILLVHNLIQAHQNAINGPMWSLGLEWQLYLLFPLLAWAFRRLRPGPTCFLALMAGVAARALYTRLPDPALAFAVRMSPISYCIIFAMGICAAKAIAAPRRDNPQAKSREKWSRLALWIGALGSFAFLFFFAGKPGTQALQLGRFHLGGGLFHDVLAALGTCCLLDLASHPQSILRRVLSAKWLVRIGLISYSIYLLHTPVFGVVMRALESRHLSRETISWLFAPLALASTLLVARVSFEWFEKPFIGAPRSKRNTSSSARETVAEQPAPLR